MKKNFSLVVLSGILALSCAFASTACKDVTDSSDKTTLTKTDYALVLNSVVSDYETYLQQPKPTASIASVVLGDEDFINQDNNESITHFTSSTMAFVLFMRNILNTDEYVLQQDAEDCVVIDEYYTFDVRFQFSYNADTSTIYAPICATYLSGQTPSVDYFVFEIVYDFTTESLQEFTVQVLFASQTQMTPDEISVIKYKNNSLFALDPNSPKKAAYDKEYLDGFTAFMATPKEDAPNDYSAQYISAMNEAGVY